MHAYTWNAENAATAVDAVGLTYDALGRLVEQNRGGAYTQILYGPDGSKLALMSGQTLQKAFVALPAGATAVYTSTGLSYYRHSDWLGSSRLASTTTRGVYYDGAYAPFGESYSETGTADRSFTGQNQDTVQAQYDFMFRRYSPNAGRWISPDPAGMLAADSSDPQSWNRYAYVLNNPMMQVDPLGLFIANCPVFVGINTANLDGGQQPEDVNIIWVPCSALQPQPPAIYNASLTVRLPTGNTGPVFTIPTGGTGGAANNCAPGTKGCFNVPTKKEACLAEYNNSAAGKGMQFLSLYNFASNLGSLKTWLEWTALPAAKVLTLSAVSRLSQAIGNTEFLSVTGGTSTVVMAPTAAGITATEAAGSVVAPLAILAATVGDMSMQSYCSGYITGAPPHGH